MANFSPLHLGIWNCLSLTETDMTLGKFRARFFTTFQRARAATCDCGHTGHRVTCWSPPGEALLPYCQQEQEHAVDDVKEIGAGAEVGYREISKVWRDLFVYVFYKHLEGAYRIRTNSPHIALLFFIRGVKESETE